MLKKMTPAQATSFRNCLKLLTPLTPDQLTNVGAALKTSRAPGEGLEDYREQLASSFSYSQVCGALNYAYAPVRPSGPSVTVHVGDTVLTLAEFDAIRHALGFKP